MIVIVTTPFGMDSLDRFDSDRSVGGAWTQAVRAGLLGTLRARILKEGGLKLWPKLMDESYVS